MRIHQLYIGLLLLFWFGFCYADNIFILCRVVQGLDLVNQTQPPLQKIQQILLECDKSQPNNVNVLLLHGLLARKLALADKNYQPAIDWLHKAVAVAAADNTVPLLELATTYEWAMQADQAKKIYDQLLNKNPHLRPALLGEARVLIQQNNPQEASQLYEIILQENPLDSEAMNGLARVMLAQKDYVGAERKFEQVLTLKPTDENAQLGLQQIKAALGKSPISEEKNLAIQTPLVSKPSPTLNPVQTVSALSVIPVTVPSIPTLQPVTVTQSNISPSCPVNQGLQWVSQEQPPTTQIKKILAECDLNQPDDVQVLLLHGLLARAEAKTNKKFQTAISWLQTAVAKAASDNRVPALELAVTYEWDLKEDKAKAIYDNLLTQDPTLLAALLGSARIALAQQRLQDASRIYEAILKKQPTTIDAINGLARVNLAEKDFLAAKAGFEKALKIAPNNAEAKIGLIQLQALQFALEHSTVRATPPMPQSAVPLSHCSANEGLKLLNEATPPINQIQDILMQCDAENPNDVQALLLHGLLARYEAKKTHHYQLAIAWLIKASIVSSPDNLSPALELAVTYQWANQPANAKAIYEQILQQNPNSTAAWLGLARVNTLQYHMKAAEKIYLALLQENPNNIEALNGLAMLELTNKNFAAAKKYMTIAQALDPENAELLANLKQLRNATKYRLDIIGGRYSVEGQVSDHAGLNFFADINATDQVYVLLEHNTNELALGLFFDPTTLPKNSASLGFVRQYPNKYGFAVNYDYRERQTQPDEHRFAFNANLYVFPKLQWFAGVREAFPTPFNNQLYWSGLTLYTPLPVNLTYTRFWGYQELPSSAETVKSRANSFGLSKEFSNHAYYNVGFSYSPTTPISPWGVFGILALPTWKNQMIEASYEHYFSNNTTFFTVGWRVYW